MRAAEQALQAARRDDHRTVHHPGAGGERIPGVRDAVEGGPVLAADHLHDALQGVLAVARVDALRRVAEREVAAADEPGLTLYDKTDLTLATILARLGPGMPKPMGVFYHVARTAYDQAVRAQIEQAKADRQGDLRSLLYGSDTWEVK